MTSLDKNGEISFGRFRLDLRRRELSHDGRPIRLRRRSMDILCALAAANGDLVSKDELIERVWPGRAVEEGNLHVHVSALRSALGEKGDGHSYVVTVPGRGYRLAGLGGFELVGLDRLNQVRDKLPNLSADRGEQSVKNLAPVAPRLSIVVLPFTNLSNDPASSNISRTGSPRT